MRVVFLAELGFEGVEQVPGVSRLIFQWSMSLGPLVRTDEIDIHTFAAREYKSRRKNGMDDSACHSAFSVLR